MKYVDNAALSAMERQMYNKARDIDCVMFNAIYQGDDPNFVLDCLMMYQTKDGGFGNQLDIDTYDPASTVIATFEALRILYMAGFPAKNDDLNFTSIIKKTCNYLYNRALKDKNRFYPLNAESNKYAHSSFYNVDNDTLKRFDFHPSMAIYAFTLYFSKTTSPYYKMALRASSELLDEYLKKDDLSYLNLISMAIYLGIVRELKLIPDKIDLLQQKLEKDILSYKIAHKNDFILCNTLCYFETKNSELSQMLDNELDLLVGDIKPHGLYEYMGDWGNDYPEFASASIKWMGVMTYRNLWILKKFKRFGM